jgi:hypothetical protein
MAMTELKTPLAAAGEPFILGAGWKSTFLPPPLRARSIAHAATEPAPAPGADTLRFEFDAESDDPAPFAALLDARTVLVTFAIKMPGGNRRLVEGYMCTRERMGTVLFVRLSSTGDMDGGSERCVRRPLLAGTQGGPTRAVWKD